jgi:hypothetical protein
VSLLWFECRKEPAIRYEAVSKYRAVEGSGRESNVSDLVLSSDQIADSFSNLHKACIVTMLVIFKTTDTNHTGLQIASRITRRYSLQLDRKYVQNFGRNPRWKKDIRKNKKKVKEG